MSCSSSTKVGRFRRDSALVIAWPLPPCEHPAITPGHIRGVTGTCCRLGQSNTHPLHWRLLAGSPLIARGFGPRCTEFDRGNT